MSRTEFRSLDTAYPETYYELDVFLSDAIYHIANVHGWGDHGIDVLNDCRHNILNEVNDVRAKIGEVSDEQF